MAASAQESVFALQLKMLRFVGISLQEKDSIFYSIYSFLTLAGLLCLPIFATHATFMNIDSFDNLMENLVFDISFVTTVSKVFIMHTIRKSIIKILRILQNGVFVSIENGKQREHKLIQEGMFYINIETLVLCVMTAIFALSANIEIINSRLTYSDPSYWSLPFGDFSALNVSNNLNFNIAWAYQSTYVFLGTLSHCAIDVFIIAVMAYVSFQCQIVQSLIRTSIVRSHARMTEDSEEITKFLQVEPSEIKWKYLQQTLREIVQYHMSLIEITTKFERLFRFQVFINFIGFSFIICLAMVYSMSMESFNYRSLQQITLAGGATTLQLTASYWGNEVILQNFAIGTACCEVDFTGTDVRFQKGLALVIHRTQVPVQFTVGKFSPLTLRTFVTVMKAAYSYYMLLNSFDKKAAGLL